MILRVIVLIALSISAIGMVIIFTGIFIETLFNVTAWKILDIGIYIVSIGLFIFILCLVIAALILLGNAWLKIL